MAFRGSPRWRKVAVLLLALLILAAIAPYLSRHPSVAYARDGDGDLRRVSGHRPIDLSLGMAADWSEINSSREISTNAGARQPLRLGSVSVLDLSGRPLSRRVAHALLEAWTEREGVHHADVHIAGDPLDDLARIGDQILVVELIEDSDPLLLVAGSCRAVLRLSLGRIPEGGWDAYDETDQRVNVAWQLEVDVDYLGGPSPAFRHDRLAEVVLETIDLDQTLEKMIEESPVVPCPPGLAIPSSPELDGSDEVPRAAGIPEEPLLSGVRFGARGEALWRYEGEDAIGRVQRCLDELVRADWERIPEVGNNGTDGRLHRFAVRKGLSTVEVHLEEDRLGDSKLDPVIWLHFVRGHSVAQLREMLARASEQGPAVREALLANLTSTQRRLLGEEESSGEPDAQK